MPSRNTNRTDRSKSVQTRCRIFPTRTNCRDCQFSSDPDLFDGCCLYGKVDPDIIEAGNKRVKEMLKFMYEINGKIQCGKKHDDGIIPYREQQKGE